MSINYPFGDANEQVAAILSAQTFTITDNLTIIDSSLKISGTNNTTTYTITPDSELNKGALLLIKYSAVSAEHVGNTLIFSGVNGTITDPIITGTTYNTMVLYNGTDFDQVSSETNW